MTRKLAPRENVAAIAASLARYGWKVFPVLVELDGEKRRKKPLVRFTEVASDDPSTIFEWWQANPDAFVGVYTRGSGLVTLDVDLSDDPTKDGPTSLRAHGLTAPETLSYPTLGGGRHHVYAAPAGRVLTVGQNLAHDGEKMGGVDIRSGNGYFVYYGDALTEEPSIAPAPEWVLVDGRAHDATHDLALADWVATLTPGKPGKRVRKAASLIHEHGTSHGTMLEATRLLAQLGSEGWVGVGEAVAQARETYTKFHPGYAADFDSALLTSANYWGPAPTFIPFTKAELKAARKLKQDVAPPASEAEGTPEERRIADEVARLSIRAEAERQFKALQRQDRPSFADRLLSRGDLAALPKPEPLVPGVLSRNSTAMLVAPPAGFKSLLAQGFAYSIATGHPWLGREVEQGRVLYIAAEGASGLDRRFQALEVAWREPLKEGLFVYPDPVDFGNAAEVAEVAAVVAGLGIDLVIGDTLNRLAPGLEENSATSMGLVVSAADSIRKAHEGCSILLLHHTGHNGNLRGSTALLAGMDQVLQLSGDGDVRTLELVKNKDGEAGKVMDVKLSPVDGTESVILNYAASFGAAGEAEQMAPRVEQALGIFRAAFLSTGATRSEWAFLLQESGLSKGVAYKAIGALANSGRVVLSGSRFSIGHVDSGSPPTDELLDPQFTQRKAS
ncbi:hypothetical protein ASF83_00115 [Plantibacter sp. Leaf171]|uniref:AAA family ATPase n=1 Tax=unclassified Plantibacter TaxID=2624265 RepID=UPI0006FA37CF|nr:MULTISPECIES: AAA family ATPase [unclassified Plantibacter]KQM17579.1 hypothetical protein ASE44_00115 [Plantibacter sp. Leaf1]KQR60362.1 hypothetical protein ASF83_00115 [Plantibacter sp. Leaf171]